MGRLTKIAVVSAALYCVSAVPAQAQIIESLPALEQKLQQFLGKGQGDPGGARHAIDRRLKLKKCPEAPVLEKRNESLAMIHCAPLDWRISVPLVRSEEGRHGSASQEMVKRGQTIMLVVQKNGFEISRQMQADRSGGLGDIIPVRTTRRARPIMAEIIGEGRVTLPAF